MPFQKMLFHALQPPRTNAQQNKQEQEKGIQKLFDHISSIYSLDQLVDSFTMSNLLKSYNNTSNVQQKYYKSKNSTLLIPLDISLKIDGITGIMPFNAFLLPKNRLPLRYQNSNVAFIIFSIDHEFGSNQWNTILRGQMIYTNGIDVDDNRPKRPGIDSPPSSTTTPQEPLETTPYGGKLVLDFPEGNFTQPKSDPKGVPLPEDTTPIEEPNTIPTGGNTRIPDSTAPIFVPSTGIQLPPDIIKARNFIIDNEVPGGVPELTAYEDLDFTVSSGKTYRIGFGSDTITTPGGSVKKVKKGDTITSDQAYADLERRLKTEFKPKVVATCEANGVNYDSLPAPVKTVFIDCAYNYGSLWNSIVISYRDGNVNGLKAELQRRANSGPGQVPKRREAEIRHLGG